MDFISIEKKWQKKWDEQRLYAFDKSRADKKYYALEMFSYPSGARLHVGHWYNYGPSDTFARFKRMQGYEVFQPVGFDAFGLPAENYAIKTGVHPQDSTLKNIETMEAQLKAMGAAFDWDSEIKTCMPDYYKWTQWIFLQLFKRGLAYRKEAPVNWCTNCNTVLANEQVQEGVCERCGSVVIRKNLTQWFFKITDYAEELLSGLEKLDWPEKTKAMQKNWIGKSVGGEVEFALENGGSFKVFTTRADTLFGVTYVVMAPENPLVDELTAKPYKERVAAYKAMCAASTEIERLSSTREKTGEFIGAYAVNPVNGKKVPIWISDYVLASYGTGAVMGVPAHDERDFEFAKKYGLSVERVIKGNENDDLPYTGREGVLVNSGVYDGMPCDDARGAILKELADKNEGGEKINYRLRDWLVSRQRYWGCPIPVVHCRHCGVVPVPEKDLPVELPYDVDFTPDGKSPLLKNEKFMNTVCPVCGGAATRDPDTLDTFVCSSWYFLRYPDSKNDKAAFDTETVNEMLPVDKYIGGAEHACMHLLYARFFTKALRDMGFLDFDEPFLSLVHQGTILGPDNQKMSKSRGNIVSPDEYVSKYGSDAFRMYLMFGFSYIEGGPWNSKGIESIVRFMERVEKLVVSALSAPETGGFESAEKELDFVRNNTIKRVREDLEIFGFNTALARIMELVNAMGRYGGKNGAFLKKCARDLILLLAPFAPHFAEELNEMSGDAASVFKKKFPEYDKAALIRDEYELAVQINSKNRAKIVVPNGADDKAITDAALQNRAVAELIKEKTVVKTIIIPGRLVNFVVK